MCDCDESYGPCEEHGKVVLQLDGGNARTADELALAFIRSTIDLMEIEVDADTASFLDEVERRLADDHWLQDPFMCQGLYEEVLRFESQLDDGWWACWEDGVTVWKLSEHCPLVER